MPAGPVVEPVRGAERALRQREGAEVGELHLVQRHDRVRRAVEALDPPGLERAGLAAVGLLVVLLGHQQDVAVGERRRAPFGGTPWRSGRKELCRMKSFQPGYVGSSPFPPRPVVVTSLGCARVGDAPHRGAVEAGVRAEAGGVEVPLVPGGRAGERLHAGGRRVGVDLDGVVEVAQVEDREPPGAVVTGGVGVACSWSAARRRRCGCSSSPGARPRDARVGGVGDVDDDQLAAADVDVLDVAGLRPARGRCRPGRSVRTCRRRTARSPQFIASFSNCSDGSTPVSAGRVGGDTS